MASFLCTLVWPMYWLFITQLANNLRKAFRGHAKVAKSCQFAEVNFSGKHLLIIC